MLYTSFFFFGKSVKRFEYAHGDWAEEHSQWCTEMCNDYLICCLFYLFVYFFTPFGGLFDQNSGVMGGRLETPALEQSSLLLETNVSGTLAAYMGSWA